MIPPEDAAHRLLRACIDGELETVRELVSGDRELANSRDFALGSTPLHFASHRGYVEIVEVLLEAGGAVGALEDCSGTTPLHWSAEGGHRAVAGLLRAAGAELDVTDRWYGLRPVDWAAVPHQAPRFHDDRDAVAAYLESEGAAPGPFGLAARGLDRRIRREVRVEQLGDRLGPAGYGAQPLHLAIAREHLAAAWALVEMGAPLADFDAFGRSPLSMALLGGMPELARDLRQAGAPADIGEALVRGDMDHAAEMVRDAPGRIRGDGDQAGLIGWFASRPSPEVVRFLLECGASPDAPVRCLGMNERITDLRPVHHAAMAGSANTMEQLLAAGADPDSVEPADQLTPLHLAAARGHIEVVRCLLRAGADPRIQDRTYHSAPIGWAQYAGHADVARVLEEATAGSAP